MFNWKTLLEAIQYRDPTGAAAPDDDGIGDEDTDKISAMGWM